MKTFFAFSLFFSLFTCSGQTISPPPPPVQTEFGSSDNGLIYSNKTITQLKHIVDSLNLKFRQCELHKTYLSLEQCKGHYVEMDKGDIRGAVTDIKNGISFEAFVKKYPKAKVEKNLLVVRNSYRNYDDETVVQYFTPNLGGSYFEVDFDADDADKEVTVGKNGWRAKYYKGSDDDDESLEAFFLAEEFAAKPLNQRFARMVQYSNCMVDTTSQIYLDGAKDRWDVESNLEVGAFMTYVHQQTGRPTYNNDDEEYDAKSNRWDSTRFRILDNISGTQEFRKLFNAALNKAKSTGVSTEEFEEYVHRYENAESALDLKRRRRVMGMCSQDDGPRVHALNIAKLSAEAVKWEVFLRAHLDIMNDRFERASDGSYAWAARKTYLKEIEVLDIDVITLLLGISLRISNEGENHYFGSIGRVGRALAETGTPDLLEEKLLSMIQDKSLDDYNRILMFYLFDHYNYYVTDKARQTANLVKLKNALATLPSHILSRIDMKKIGEEN